MPTFDHQEHRVRQGNWAAIQPGDWVVLYGPKPEMHATVEDRTADGSVIWIRDELNERRLIHIDDYSEVCFVEILTGRGEEISSDYRRADAIAFRLHSYAMAAKFA